MWWSLHPEGQRRVQAQATPALLLSLVAGGSRSGAVAPGQTVHGPLQ